MLEEAPLLFLGLMEEARFVLDDAASLVLEEAPLLLDDAASLVLEKTAASWNLPHHLHTAPPKVDGSKGPKPVE